MSRIEKALEKANLMRGQDAVSGVLTVENMAEPQAQPMPEFFSSEVAVKTDNPYLAVLNEPNSPAAEEYRKLKSMVVKYTKKGSSLLNTLMVTSTAASEGKSLTALNLAITLAQEYDHTVLLVDADLRRPSLHKYLGIEPRIGLSDCISEGRDISQALIRTGIGNLVLLPSGNKVSDPVELLLSGKMKSLIREVKHRYADRYVIFDTPPVLPFAEAHSIGLSVDGVIFVVREGVAPLGNVKEALDMLKGTNIIGVAYNDVEVSSLDSDYHYRGYYSRGEK